MISAFGTSYPESFPEDLIATLERYRLAQDPVRLRFEYDGYTETGYVSRTMGNPNYPNGGTKAAMLVHNRRSRGGPCLFSVPVRVTLTRAPFVRIWDAK